MEKPIRILIILDGGLITEVHCDAEHEVVVIDHDAEEYGSDLLEAVKLPDGREAYVSQWEKQSDNHADSPYWKVAFPEA